MLQSRLPPAPVEYYMPMPIPISTTTSSRSGGARTQHHDHDHGNYYGVAAAPVRSGRISKAARTAAGLPIRRRISRACDQCNQLRTKCDGKLPCQHCIDFSLGCEYARKVKKRGKASRKDIAAAAAAAAAAEAAAKQVSSSDPGSSSEPVIKSEIQDSSNTESQPPRIDPALTPPPHPSPPSTTIRSRKPSKPTIIDLKLSEYYSSSHGHPDQSYPPPPHHFHHPPPVHQIYSPSPPLQYHREDSLPSPYERPSPYEYPSPVGSHVYPGPNPVNRGVMMVSTSHAPNGYVYETSVPQYASPVAQEHHQISPGGYASSHDISPVSGPHSPHPQHQQQHQQAQQGYWSQQLPSPPHNNQEYGNGGEVRYLPVDPMLQQESVR